MFNDAPKHKQIIGSVDQNWHTRRLFLTVPTYTYICTMASQMVPVVKTKTKQNKQTKKHVNAGDVKEADSIPRSCRSPGGGHGNPL